MPKAVYHRFKRILPDAEPNDPPWEVEARVKPATAIATIELTEAHILEAMRRQGYADGQNCAGGICVLKQRANFNHPLMPLVDWWYRRVYICESINRKTGKAVCRVYAHFDNIAELFDTDIEGLLARVRKEGSITITLYPVKKGRHSRTGKPTNAAGRSGPGGKSRRAPHAIGSELRVLTHMRAFSKMPAAA